jgi:SNF2 family DNA or RNA helicase
MYKFINEDKYNCLIVSYDTFRIHGACLIDVADLMICDEGHKIKNRKIKQAKALNACNTKRRIILTGTPI